MRVSIDEAGYETPALEIEFGCTGRRQFTFVAANGNYPAATDQHMTKTQGFGCEDLGIGKEFQQVRGPCTRNGGAILHYPITPKQMVCRS